MRLWFEKHQRNFNELADFEDDDIENFEGHDILDDEEEDDGDDMAWLHPPKGPGEFRNLKKKKKKNKKKKKESDDEEEKDPELKFLDQVVK